MLASIHVDSWGSSPGAAASSRRTPVRAKRDPQRFYARTNHFQQRMALRDASRARRDEVGLGLAPP